MATGCARKQFFQTDARPDTQAGQVLGPAADSVRGVTAGRQYARHGRLYNALVGKHYRTTWAAPVTAPVLRLSEARPGGLRPGKVGGGFNSTNVNLTTATGEAYVLRTVDKDPSRATPRLLQRTFLLNALRDNVSATNPYASLVVPPLAQAVGVPRVAPRLFYVRADDPMFQSDSLRLFRGQLAYLEEKAAVPPGFPYPSREDVMGSEAAFAATFAASTNQINQVALLRARLLDGWLGDWDRHPGQWNWRSAPPTKSGVVPLLPLPKDRDMAFYRLDDGLLGWLVGYLAIPHWTTFRSKYPNTIRLLSSGSYLDSRGLNRLTRAQFNSAALRMQQQLPDSLIEQAVKKMPPAAFALEGRRIMLALQARRDALSTLATAFYEQLARHPVVGGTAEPERFEVHRYPDSTVVTVHSLPANPGNPAAGYRRAFLPTETRSIQLEGLGGNDVFQLEQHGGKSVNRIRLVLYGGAGADELQEVKRGHGLRFSQDSAPAKRAYDQPPVE